MSDYEIVWNGVVDGRDGDLLNPIGLGHPRIHSVPDAKPALVTLSWTANRARHNANYDRVLIAMADGGWLGVPALSAATGIDSDDVYVVMQRMKRQKRIDWQYAAKKTQAEGFTLYRLKRVEQKAAA